MDDLAADQVICNMEKESLSIETSDLAPSKPNNLFVKLKISKSTLRGGQHICPVCSKAFSSGKALGGHIRIHMKGSKNGRHRKILKLQPRKIHRSKPTKRIAKNLVLPKATDDHHGAADLPLIDEEEDQANEKVSCCICNKEFKSMKSLFGHMRNHPERGWRGIRPPPSEKNSCCSSVSENDEALEVDQISSLTGKSSDLLKSLPKWTNHTAKRCGKSIPDESEIAEAANILMMLAGGGGYFFGLGQKSVGCQRKNSPMAIDKRSRPWGLAIKASEEKKRINGKEMDHEDEGKGKATSTRLKRKSDHERSGPPECERRDSYKLPEEEEEEGEEEEEEEGEKMGKLIKKELNCDEFQDRENYNAVADIDGRFDQFQKLSMMPDVELEGMKGRCTSGSKRSQKPSLYYPKNPSSSSYGGSGAVVVVEAGLLNKVASLKQEHEQEQAGVGSKTLVVTKAAGIHQVRSPKTLDFDLNKPYVDLDADDADDDATATLT